ncbi:hypothetical protein P4H66_06325 [Paenibacillus dokdonensis]|uniref:YopX protein domain-containing protein n=1 Tax=Paenibacillus dokdonensis TaxID=2567944 RepID=A0ABU6GMK1_9BACL|nr:hypothetical protein [Paenibacillus dokdonensis]MEC0239471.1 hypothetical protein [Paenibacillus dokdonensis]
MKNRLIDLQEYSDTATVFNKKKFYPGRAILLEGMDEEGDSIHGTYLIKSVNHDRMCVTDSNGKEVTVFIDWLLSEFDHAENETYEPSIVAELYGYDLA